MSSEDDPSFVALAARLRRRIDDAFNSVALQPEPEVSAGDFVAEDQGYEAGGFIIEDAPSSSGAGVQSYIPLSEIPRALSQLDLFPDDDLMAVFKNAATGWGAQNERNERVSRRDWRAVCAAILEDDGSDEENGIVDLDVGMGTDSVSDSDGYETEAQSGDTEENEYQNRTPRRTKPGKNVARTKDSRELSATQKAQCRQDFSRFFPHVPDDELDRQRIGIRDLTRVAGVLKENLKAEEMLEMLEAFSTSPDKSMGLADFEHMMALTKLA